MNNRTAIEKSGMIGREDHMSVAALLVILGDSAWFLISLKMDLTPFCLLIASYRRVCFFVVI